MSSSMCSTDLKGSTTTWSGYSKMVSILTAGTNGEKEVLGHFYNELTYDIPYNLWLDIINHFKNKDQSVLDLVCRLLLEKKKESNNTPAASAHALVNSMTGAPGAGAEVKVLTVKDDTL